MNVKKTIEDDTKEILKKNEHISIEDHNETHDTQFNYSKNYSNVQKANNELLEAKRIISEARHDNLKEMRQIDLDSCKTFFDQTVRRHATDAEAQTFDNLARTSQRSIDRNDNVIYICYDNEAYMNTGIQKSGLTPFGAKTTTTPAGQNIHGNIRPKKNMFEIVAAHDIPYAATATVGYMPDFLNKVEKASKIQGTKYIHVIAPCPTGWGIPVSDTIDSAREIVDCGLWYLAEYENGEFTLNKDPKTFTSVEEYLRKQARFKHLTDEDIQLIIDSRDAKWEKIRKNWKK